MMEAVLLTQPRLTPARTTRSSRCWGSRAGSRCTSVLLTETAIPVMMRRSTPVTRSLAVASMVRWVPTRPLALALPATAMVTLAAMLLSPAMAAGAEPLRPQIDEA